MGSGTGLLRVNLPVFGSRTVPGRSHVAVVDGVVQLVVQADAREAPVGAVGVFGDGVGSNRRWTAFAGVLTTSLPVAGSTPASAGKASFGLSAWVVCRRGASWWRAFPVLALLLLSFSRVARAGLGPV